MTITNENDEAYANAAFINNSEEIVVGWKKKANHFRSKKLKSGKAKLDIAYGASDRQKYDIFQPDSKPLGSVIFVHGGYWISVPNVGVFVKSLNAGRKRLAGVVKRRKRNEMLLWDLEKMKLPGLGMRYLVRDAIGSGMFQQVSCVCVCGGVGILFQIFTPDFLFLCLFADRNYLRAVAAFVQKEFMKGW